MTIVERTKGFKLIGGSCFRALWSYFANEQCRDPARCADHSLRMREEANFLTTSSGIQDKRPEAHISGIRPNRHEKSAAQVSGPCGGGGGDSLGSYELPSSTCGKQKLEPNQFVAVQETF